MTPTRGPYEGTGPLAQGRQQLGHPVQGLLQILLRVRVRQPDRICPDRAERGARKHRHTGFLQQEVGDGLSWRTRAGGTAGAAAATTMPS